MQFNIRNPIVKSKSNSIFSKITATLFLSVFGGMGTFFAVMLIRELVLKKAEWPMAFFLIIPVVFMFIGFGGIYGVWFGKAKESKVVSKARNMKMGKGGLILFGLVFMAAGLVASYFLLIRPVVNTLQAKGWSETPCKIISAKVESHSDSDGTGLAPENWSTFSERFPVKSSEY